MVRLPAGRTLDAWHFLRADKKLRYNDERLVEVGKTLSIEPGFSFRPCVCGMHASERITSAFGYFAGFCVFGRADDKRLAKNEIMGYLCRVTLSDEIIHPYRDVNFGISKHVARSRTVKWMIPVTREQAHRWNKLHNSAYRGYRTTDKLIAARLRGVEYKIRNEVMAVHRELVKAEKNA